MRWEFVKKPGTPTQWRWQCVDEATGSIIKLSLSTFTTLLDCVEDARRNGYTGPAGPDITPVARFEATIEVPVLRRSNGRA